jgi:hypothetical protein
LYKTLKEFLASLEPKFILGRKDEKKKTPETIIDSTMNIDSDDEMNLERMQQTYSTKKNQNNKINMFAIK